MYVQISSRFIIAIMSTLFSQSFVVGVTREIEASWNWLLSFKIWFIIWQINIYLLVLWRSVLWTFQPLQCLHLEVYLVHYPGCQGSRNSYYPTLFWRHKLRASQPAEAAVSLTLLNVWEGSRKSYQCHFAEKLEGQNQHKLWASWEIKKKKSF